MTYRLTAHDRDVISRFTHEAKYHRSQARRLRSKARHAKGKGDYITALRLTCSANERTRLAQEADRYKADIRQGKEIAR